ncbi:hypothetical protein THAOC_34384 [Thalassiosira oceanica]|uniref:Uncharacterized protein n=1 Tax=Thalassiosira oceanica TaxID=159749 RepID=K0R514_THAOC|nr:hypothetical protein THAOC_34384 [Thalassiosira oceanica]|eukprot:EJK46929.1 hypothetical protein THAOC_34384 [Thalassiosira oceanica]
MRQIRSAAAAVAVLSTSHLQPVCASRFSREARQRQQQQETPQAPTKSTGRVNSRQARQLRHLRRKSSSDDRTSSVSSRAEYIDERSSKPGDSSIDEARIAETSAELLEPESDFLAESASRGPQHADWLSDDRMSDIRIEDGAETVDEGSDLILASPEPSSPQHADEPAPAATVAHDGVPEIHRPVEPGGSPHPIPMNIGSYVDIINPSSGRSQPARVLDVEPSRAHFNYVLEHGLTRSPIRGVDSSHVHPYSAYMEGSDAYCHVDHLHADYGEPVNCTVRQTQVGAGFVEYTVEYEAEGGTREATLPFGRVQKKL